MTSMLPATCLLAFMLCFAPSANAQHDAPQKGAAPLLIASVQTNPHDLLPLHAFSTPSAQAAQAIALQAGWKELTDRLISDGFDPAYIYLLYARLGEDYSPDPMARKIKTLYKRKYAPPPKKSKPAAKAPAKKGPPPVYKGVVTKANIEKTAAFMQQHRDTLLAAEKKYGIPAEVATGLLFVETRLGAFLGSAAALHNLSSLAATGDVTYMQAELSALDLQTQHKLEWTNTRTRQKADWAYKELKALLAWSQEHNLDPVAMPGSIYGAVGLCQFMPTNISLFGADGDGNGKVNLFSVPDAVFSLSRYLHEHGWKEGITRQKQHKVLMKYNKSTIYANTILALADELKKYTAATP
ncbi:MAG: lytic murein transglycosylase [Oleidesulfovibrio sp.]